MIGTVGAVAKVVQRPSILASFFVLIGFAGCIPCESQVTDSALAPRPDFDRAIDACITQHSCTLLCRDLFQLDPSIQIESCQVTKVNATDANVIVRYYDASTCSGDDGVDIGFDDWSDDSGDSGDDGSTDDGSGDGSDDGSGDGSDSGSDSGSDTGSDSGGDGSPRKALEQRANHAATIAR